MSDIDQEGFAKFVHDVFEAKGRAHSTKVGYINAFTSLFSWLRARYPKSIAHLYTKKLIPTGQEAAAEQRDPFTLEQLRALFENAASYRHTAPHKFWPTVVAAFMGCRIEELAQVHLRTDFRHELDGDIWYLDFNERPDPDGVTRKSLKQPASRRLAPIHSALVRHGFVDFLQAEQQAGFERPFQRGWQPWKDPDKGVLRWAHYISKWGSRELAKLDKSGKLIRDGKKLAFFHSMRHSFAQLLAERHIRFEDRAALQGQAVEGGGENANRYVNLRENVKFLSDIVEANLIDYATILDDVLRTA